jgi:hypothetical protein
MANILPILHAIKLDLRNGLVSLFLGSPYCIGKANDAEHAAAVGMQCAVGHGGARMKGNSASAIFWNAGNGIAFAWRIWVLVRCQHNPKGGTAIPFQLYFIELAVDRFI